MRAHTGMTNTTTMMSLKHLSRRKVFKARAFDGGFVAMKKIRMETEKDGVPNIVLIELTYLVLL